jgi:hypothetical protein
MTDESQGGLSPGSMPSPQSIQPQPLAHKAEEGSFKRSPGGYFFQSSSAA